MGFLGVQESSARGWLSAYWVGAERGVFKNCESSAHSWCHHDDVPILQRREERGGAEQESAGGMGRSGLQLVEGGPQNWVRGGLGKGFN